MFARIASLAITYRKAVVVAWLVVLVVAGVGASRMALDFSSRSFYGDGDAGVEALERFHERWGLDDNTVIVVTSDGSGAGSGMLDPKHLDELENLARELERQPHVVRAFSVADLPVRPSPPPVAPWAPGLVSADGKHTVLLVELDFSSDDLQSIVPVVHGIEAALSRSEHAHGLDHQLAGLPAMRAAFFTLTMRDQARFIPVTVLLIGLGLTWAFRSVAGVVIPGIAASAPLLLLIGVMGWVGEPLGLLNQAYVTLIPVLSVAGAVHMLARVREDLHTAWANSGPNDTDARQVISHAAGKVGMACSLSSLTTAVGFASIGIMGMPILRNFGLYAALGLLLSLLTVLVLVPALLAFANPRKLAKTRRRKAPAVLRVCADLATRKPRLVLIGALALTLLAGWGASRVEIDNSLGDLLQPDHPVRQAADLVDDDLGGTLALEVDLEGDFDRTETRAEVDAFMTWAAKRPEVRVVLGPGRDTVARVSEDKRHAWVTLRTTDMGGRAFADFERATEDALTRLAPSSTFNLTGTASVAYSGVNRITEELGRSLLLVFAIVLTVIGVLFRSARIALLSALPNGLPMLMAVAVLGFASIRLDPLGAVITTMALGVAVDDTIHLLARAREGLDAGASPERALTAAIETTGRSAGLTTALLVGGLAINGLSAFPPLVLVGILGSLVIAFALAADILVLPALMMLAGRSTLGRRSS